MIEKKATRRGFLSVAVTAIVVGVVAGVGGYYAGLLSAPPPGAPVTTTTTRYVTSTATVTAAPAKNSIVIGFPLAMTGWAAVGAETQHRNLWFQWRDYVNEAGGIYVEEYGKKLPVEFVYYDDGSDVETAVRLCERLATVDKVDFMFPAYADDAQYAVHPVFEKYHYPQFAHTAMCLPARMIERDYPWFYAMSPRIDKIAGNMSSYIKNVNDNITPLKTLGVIYCGALFGKLNADAVVPLLQDAGLNIAINKSYPLPATDFSPLIKEMNNAGVDCAICISLTETILYVKQSIELGLNPKVFLTMVGTHWGHFPEIIGGETGRTMVEGVTGPAKWNLKLAEKLGGKNPTMEKFCEDHLAKWEIPADMWDMGGFCMMQILQQAIEKAGTLDRDEVKKKLDTETFDTSLGPCNYEKYLKINQWSYCGDVGPGNSFAQWQNGYYELIWPKDWATSDPIVPKPAWPS